MASSGEKLGIAAIIAVAAGVVGLVSSLLTLYLQVDSAVLGAIKRDFAPIGTVIVSTLKPSVFAKAIGEAEGALPINRKWILADGRVVEGIAFGLLIPNPVG